jgi:hypothetical protein
LEAGVFGKMPSEIDTILLDSSTRKATMKGDFTRNTFDVNNLFNRVLMQQGRVTLDADFNEQVDILLHYLQNLARDLIGPYAAPSADAGFRISADQDGILITAGRYYVDGILVENKLPCLYSDQPYYSVPHDDGLLKMLEDKNQDEFYWLYLDVWERHITAIESDGIREKALGGPDTCTRTQYVWQVKAILVETGQPGYYGYPYPYPYSNPNSYPYKGPYALPGYPYPYPYDGQPELRCDGPLDGLVDVSRVQLAARVDPGKKHHDACITAPDSKYVGVENHLYRVEIHQGGSAGTATFKWSRDNGSVVTPWLDTNSSEGNKSTDLTVTSSRGFSAGCWVELTDEWDDLHERPGILVRVAKVGSGVLSLDSASIPGTGLPDRSKLLNPKVRRWDQTAKGDIQLDGGAVKVVETPITTDAAIAGWIDLEDGIQIAFAQMPFSDGAKYRSGDYWLIPARVATGKIEWPPAKEAEKMSLVAPQGVVHHYAPLAFAVWHKDKLNFQACNCEFEPISSCLGGQADRGFGEENIMFPVKNLEGVTKPKEVAEAPAPTPAAKQPTKRSRAKKKPQ